MQKSKKGQTMVEYIIIVALIAIALIAVFKTFGGKIKEAVEESSDKLDSEVIQDIK